MMMGEEEEAIQPSMAPMNMNRGPMNPAMMRNRFAMRRNMAMAQANMMGGMRGQGPMMMGEEEDQDMQTPMNPMNMNRGSMMHPAMMGNRFAMRRNMAMAQANMMGMRQTPVMMAEEEEQGVQTLMTPMNMNRGWGNMTHPAMMGNRFAMRRNMPMAQPNMMGMRQTPMMMNRGM